MSHKSLWLFNFIISLKIILVKKHFLNMFRNTIFLLTTLFLISCKKPKDKIEDIVLYQDSIGYWNYEWPRKGAEYWGFTFKFMKNNKLQKLSFNKIENKRWAWNDYPYVESIYRWGVANDSIFTFMNYNSKIKITKYNKNAINLINQNNIPLVLVDREMPECQTNFVRCDDYQGGYIAGKHLLELGHRHFLYLPGPKYNLSQTRRYAGIMDALSEANVPASNIREIDYHTVFGSSAESTSSYKPYEELFFPVNYTAVIGFNDLQSYSAMEILQKKGYRIPEDISLISFDHLRKTHKIGRAHV